METVRLKIGREIFEINENDIIIDNGSCYQLVTQKIGNMVSGYYPPIVSKKLFNSLKKTGQLLADEKTEEYKRKKYNGTKIECYRFDIEKMKQEVCK